MNRIKLVAFMLLLPAWAYASCREGYVPTDVEGVCQQQPLTNTNATWVSDENPPEDKMPSWQREGVYIVDVPNMADQDLREDRDKVEADREGKRRAGIK